MCCVCERRREGGREGGRERGREGGKEGGREKGGREGRREGERREGGREGGLGGREGSREGREGGTEGEINRSILFLCHQLWEVYGERRLLRTFIGKAFCSLYSVLLSNFGLCSIPFHSRPR